MKSLVIEDTLHSNNNNYLFRTEYLDNFIFSKIFILDTNEKRVVKEIKKRIESIGSTKDEMVDFHNKILSNFFRALRNGDKKPENSTEDIEIDVNIKVGEIKKEDNIFNKYSKNILNSDVISILIEKLDYSECLIYNETTIPKDELRLDMKFVYKMVQKEKSLLKNTIGDIEFMVFSYKEYQILYFYAEDITIILAISSKNILSKSIKIAKKAQSDILLSLNSTI